MVDLGIVFVVVGIRCVSDVSVNVLPPPVVYEMKGEKMMVGLEMKLKMRKTFKTSFMSGFTSWCERGGLKSIVSRFLPPFSWVIKKVLWCFLNKCGEHC